MSKIIGFYIVLYFDYVRMGYLFKDIVFVFYYFSHFILENFEIVKTLDSYLFLSESVYCFIYRGKSTTSKVFCQLIILVQLGIFYFQRNNLIEVLIFTPYFPRRLKLNWIATQIFCYFIMGIRLSALYNIFLRTILI